MAQRHSRYLLRGKKHTNAQRVSGERPMWTNILTCACEPQSISSPPNSSEMHPLKRTGLSRCKTLRGPWFLTVTQVTGREETWRQDLTASQHLHFSSQVQVTIPSCPDSFSSLLTPTPACY